MKLKILYVSLFCSFLSLAQSPNGITYQAVIRAGEDVIVSNQTISVNIKIKQGSSSGIDVYSEKHSVTSNTNGLITLIIGKGTTTNNFSDIDWSQGPYFVESSYDLQGGENYTISNTSQLLSVPYALYAENAGNTTAGPPGTPGEEGKSAYQIWLALGNTGSEAEFLTSLTGPQGIAGKNSLTKTRQRISAQKFLIKAIENNVNPELINIDKSGTNKAAIKLYNRRNYSKIKINGSKEFLSYFKAKNP